MNKKELHLLWITGIGLTGNVIADSSPRIYSAETGSYYQIFYSGTIDEEKRADDAQADCKAQGGHLTTVTSKAENNFLNTQMAQYASYFWIGASDTIVEGQWKWATGEPWNYTAWADSQPSSSGGTDYAYFNVASNVDGGRWYAYNNYAESYVCEWESDYVQNTATIGDLTGDHVAEIGVYKLAKGIRTVNLINPVTGNSVSKLTFGSVKSIENSFIAPVSDMNGNKKPEVAVMYKKLNGPNAVVIKAPNNNAVTLASFNVTNGATDILSMVSVPDLNGNGVSELQFLTKSTVNGAGQLIIFDPKTKVKLKTIKP
jgi:hypothetical protein